MGADGVSIPLMLLLALALRRGSIEQALQVSPWLFALAAAIFLLCFHAMGMYRAVFRFIAHGGLFKFAFGVVLSTCLLAALNAAVFDRPITINSIAIFGALALLYVLASRSVVRELLYFRRGTKDRVIIYGAGAAGAQLARALRETGEYLPVAFVDDDPVLQRKVVAGIKVSAPQALLGLIKRQSVDSVLLAIPSSSRRQRQRILKSLEQLPVSVRTVPNVNDIVNGYATVADLRDVDANDLLGRDPVDPDARLLEACIKNKVVMVSGAGGSIGSELCRQIVRLAPDRILLLELSEAALYRVEKDLRSMLPPQSSVEIVSLLGNAMHRPRIRELMQTYGVHTVYHAAAYKHVPIVEHNVVEGVRNNVFSTLCMAESAIECGVETFVLISTDKAVNPTNVMGATKRFAELILQGLQARTTTTRFCMVRFGNVLESSGSVVPLFREQIKRGGPVTVTHKDIIRYFMTIPEAAQLVLQAGSMAKGGDVFVLDMGEPVRILDLARRMIRLMGATVRDENTPDGDIEIVFTGLRPGEKLFEELLIGSNVSGTHHPMIMRADEPHRPWSELQHVLTALRAAIDSYDCDTVRALIMETVAEYRPEAGIQDLVWQRKMNGRGIRPVTEIGARGARPLQESVAAAVH
jgi:FlaA1/EpsC-like NDP-sugar epimerase